VDGFVASVTCELTQTAEDQDQLRNLRLLSSVWDYVYFIDTR